MCLDQRHAARLHRGILVGPAQRQSLRQSSYVECPQCRGTGYIKNSETAALQVLREIRAGLSGKDLDTVEIDVSADVSNYLSNEMRGRLDELETDSGKAIRVLVDPSMSPGRHAVRFLAAGGRKMKAPKG